MSPSQIKEIPADGMRGPRVITRSQRTLIVASATAAIVIAANGSQGAYFSQSWGWVALAFLVPTTVVLILERATLPGRLRIALVALFAVYASWIALSSLWSLSTPATIREVERMLAYVAVAFAVAFVLRRGDLAAVLAGVSVGVAAVAAYAFATRAFPDRLHSYDDTFASYRLAQPVGYWNALGLLATLGIVVSLGFVAHARRFRSSVAGAAVLPVLGTTLYFTFSRGGWGALGVGLVATVVLDPRRLRFVWMGSVVAAPTILCVVFASRQDALTTEGAPAASAAHEGHRAAAVLLAATLGSCLAAWCGRLVAERWTVSRRQARLADVVLVCLAVGAIVAVLVAIGGPAEGLSRVKADFTASPDENGRLNNRLLSLSGNGRNEQYHVAWDAARRHPVVGNGSGTFEYLWYQHRRTDLVVRDAHSLYLETFAEVGIVGLALLASGLLVLVVGGMRARRARFAASGTAALLAWSAAAAVDWHWEMVGLTLVALLSGSAALVASERRSRPLLGGRARGALVVAGIALSFAAVWSLVGNQALFAAKAEVGRQNWVAAANDGRRARALLRWSAEPDLVLGDAAAGAGDRDGALVAYRNAVSRDPSSWVAWLRLAQVARGTERAHALERVRHLDPRDQDLPGQR